MKKIAITLNLLSLCFMALSFFGLPESKIEEADYEVIEAAGGTDGPTSLFISNNISLVDLALPSLIVTSLI